MWLAQMLELAFLAFRQADPMSLFIVACAKDIFGKFRIGGVNNPSWDFAIINRHEKFTERFAHN
jgi:hypothetical protein